MKALFFHVIVSLDFITLYMDIYIIQYVNYLTSFKSLTLFLLKAMIEYEPYLVLFPGLSALPSPLFAQYSDAFPKLN